MRRVSLRWRGVGELASRRITGGGAVFIVGDVGFIYEWAGEAEWGTVRKCLSRSFLQPVNSRLVTEPVVAPPGLAGESLLDSHIPGIDFVAGYEGLQDCGFQDFRGGDLIEVAVDEDEVGIVAGEQLSLVFLGKFRI